MCYFSHAFQYPQATVSAICYALNDPKFGRVDFIVGTGISGTLMLVPVSMQSGIPCVAARKFLDTDTSLSDGGCHSPRRIETYLPDGQQVYRYVIIDDVIESGRTIAQIEQKILAEYRYSQCVGIILYQNYISRKDEVWHGIPLVCLNEDIVELANMRKEGMLI